MASSTLMTIEEVAKYLKVSTRTLYRLVQQRRIPAIKVGRQWRFRKDDVFNYLLKVTWHPPKKWRRQKDN